jgi:hypothetical protein
VPHRRRNIPPALLILSAAALFCCQTEQRVVGMKGGLSGLGRLPGGTAQLPPESLGGDPNVREPGKGAQAGGDQWTRLLGKEDPGEPIEGRPLRRKLPDGGVILLSRSPRELIANLYETLQDNETQLIEEQIISAKTKRAYLAERKPASEAVAWLFKNRKDVEALIAAMPAGEQTPGVFMKPLGGNAFRLTMGAGSEMLDVKFRTLDVVIEQGRFRLLMIQ